MWPHILVVSLLICVCRTVRELCGKQHRVTVVLSLAWYDVKEWRRSKNLQVIYWNERHIVGFGHKLVWRRPTHNVWESCTCSKRANQMFLTICINRFCPNIRHNKADILLPILVLHSKARPYTVAVVLACCVYVDGRCFIKIEGVLKDHRFL
jgi:hypothetical protein